MPWDLTHPDLAQALKREAFGSPPPDRHILYPGTVEEELSSYSGLGRGTCRGG